MISTVEQKKPPLALYPRDIEFFKSNYPIHHIILLEMIERGEIQVVTDNKEGARA